MNVPQNFAAALQHHQAGRLAEAEALYRQILAVEPNHAEALHHLGVLAHQAGKPDIAIDLLRRAIALMPSNSSAHLNLGTVLAAKGCRQEAMREFRTTLDLEPEAAEAHLNLGLAMAEDGQWRDAIHYYRRALALQPDFAPAHLALAKALVATDSLDDAAAAYRRTTELAPDFPGVFSSLGEVLEKLARPDEAAIAFGRALESNPGDLGSLFRFVELQGKRGNHEPAIAACHRAIAASSGSAEALNILGIALVGNEKAEDAVTIFRQALALKPEAHKTHCNLSNALGDLDRLDEAIASANEALRYDPELPEAHMSLGNALHGQGKFDSAIAAYRDALKFRPDYAHAKFNIALLLLLLGDFESAWPLYEARWEAFHTSRPDYASPAWDGSVLHGQTVLLCAEQGLGDMIQFVRYASLVVAAGGQAVVQCQRSLADLLRTAGGVSRVVTNKKSLPDFDFHLPLLSLPLVLHTTPETIPRGVPYLHSDPVRQQSWRDRLGDDRSRLRVGLAWRGNTADRRLRKRHAPLEALLPLCRVDGADFFSLQISQGAEQLGQLANPSPIIDHTAHIHDFADTAAFIMELDLVISVDTAVAHLAGALGAPVWTLLPFVPDWRWGLESERTPWYPTMRLFRQLRPGDWEDVIRRVAQELSSTTRETLHPSAETPSPPA